MCKILGFIRIKRKTKTDEQIDEIQSAIADELTLISSKMDRTISRIMQIIDMNSGKPVVIKRNVTKMIMYTDDIKNLASDLRADARL